MTTAIYEETIKIIGGINQGIIFPDGRAGMMNLVKLNVTDNFLLDGNTTDLPALGIYYAPFSRLFLLSENFIGDSSIQVEGHREKVAFVSEASLTRQRDLTERIIKTTEEWIKKSRNLGLRHIIRRLDFGFRNLDLTLAAYQQQVKDVAIELGANVRLLRQVQQQQKADWVKTLNKEAGQGTVANYIDFPTWESSLAGHKEELLPIEDNRWHDRYYRNTVFKQWLALP